VLRKDELKLWVSVRGPDGGVLDVRESERARFPRRTGSGPASTCRHRGRCALRSREAHPHLLAARASGAGAHGARCEALPPFQKIVQPLSRDAGDWQWRSRIFGVMPD